MIEALALGAAGGGIVLVLILVVWVKGLTTDRRKDIEEDLENWEGVLDVKREIKDKLDSDRDYINRLHEKFND